MGSYRIALSSYQLAKKIPFGDPFWKPFNRSFQNVELSAMDLAGAIYDGFAFTVHHKNNWRSTENYLCGQYLALDFDTCDQQSEIATLKANKFISKYAGLLYTTISHTQEAPRARVVFPLDAPIMQAKNYVLAASALLWLFGTADRQCRDAARFFYGAPGCQIEYLDNVLPLETVRHLIEQYKTTGTQERRRHESGAYHAPADQAEVADALRRIPAWSIDYDEWVQVLMGIHAAFGDDGRRLADDWADGKDGEVEQKWRGFKANGNAVGSVTIATVFGIAKRFGWQKATHYV
jgi:hypothetical protein